MAKRVKAYQFSARFKKEYNDLPKEIQKAFDKKLQIFLQNMTYPSLRVKRIQGTRNRWEGSVTMKYRASFIYRFTLFRKSVYYRIECRR